MPFAGRNQFLTLKQLFAYFLVNKCIGAKKKFRTLGNSFNATTTFLIQSLKTWVTLILIFEYSEN